MSNSWGSMRDLPIRRKLMLMVMLASGAALVVAAIILIVLDLLTFRSALQRDLMTIAAITADNSTAALSFEDVQAANETLAVLAAKPDIRSACIYGEEGAFFASYHRPGEDSICPERPRPDTAGFTADALAIYQPVVLGERQIGTLYLESSLEGFRELLTLRAAMFALVLIFAGLVAFLISSRLQGLISKPVLRLARTANKISNTKDFSLRATKETNDEVGQLVDAFNQMLDQLSKRDAQMAEVLDREQRAREEAEKSNRLKEEFLATISHELRTPLTAIIGWIRLMKARKLDPDKWRNAIEVIDRNAEMEVRLVNDVLDASRIISGKLQIEFDLVDVVSVLEATVNAARPDAEARHLTIDTHVEPVPRIWGNATRLQQVFWNLISNAIKFTAAGGSIDVSMSVSGAYVEVRVADTGIGISPDFLPFVFERFRQADASTTRKYGGLGLGLAIVRHLVELHEGTVSADSRGTDQGSVFTVRLPLTGISVTENEISDSTPAVSSLDSVQVLVVEDDKDTREVLCILLHECGAIVRGAASYEDALEVLGDFKPDVLLIDIGMPAHNGYALIAKVRTTKNLGQIPAIAVTAYATEADRNRAIAAGFQAHVAKPFRPEELVRVVADTAKRGAAAER